MSYYWHGFTPYGRESRYGCKCYCACNRDSRRDRYALSVNSNSDNVGQGQGRRILATAISSPRRLRSGTSGGCTRSEAKLLRLDDVIIETLPSGTHELPFCDQKRFRS